MPVSTRIQVRRDTIANWTSTNPTLAAGEIGLETDVGGGWKFGDGSTAWNSLRYSDPAVDAARRYLPPAGVAPTIVAGTNAGTTPPSPVVTSCTDSRGRITFGSGSSPAIGLYVTVTYGTPFAANTVVNVTPTNAATSSRQPYITAASTTGFSFGLGVVATASQPNTTYGFYYTVSP